MDSIFFGWFSRSAVVLAVLMIAAGCKTTPAPPLVVVNVTEAPAQKGRFRVAERQRDLWIAPQAINNEILQHDQTVTFVEKPQAWRLPSTLEPNTVSPPQLPIEEGGYDAGVLRRQREMLEDQRNQVLKLSGDLEEVKSRSQQAISQREEQAKESEAKFQESQKRLASAFQKLEEIERAEKLRGEQKAKKPWWKLWQ